MAHHPDEVCGGAVDAERDLLVLEVVHRVEVAQEQLSEDEVLVVELIQTVLRNGELALAVRLVQVLAGTDLEDRVTSLVGAGDEEADGAEGLLYVVTRLVALAEVGVRRAVEVWHCLLPGVLERRKQGRRHSDKGRACIDDGREDAAVAVLLVAVVDASAGQGPGLDVAEDVRVVAERTEAGRATDDLLLVDATEHGETGLGRK